MSSKCSVKYGTNCHKILLISKFYGKKISFEELNFINPLKFKKKYSINRDLLRLVTNNLIKANSDMTEWQITTNGIITLYETAERKMQNERSDRSLRTQTKG